MFLQETHQRSQINNTAPYLDLLIIQLFAGLSNFGLINSIDLKERLLSDLTSNASKALFFSYSNSDLLSEYVIAKVLSVWVRILLGRIGIALSLIHHGEWAISMK